MVEINTILNSPLLAAAVFAVGYLLGSIPFGLIITRFAGLGDVRSIGSGNIGATNVLRTGNRKLAAATLLLDALKGTIAVLVGAAWGMDYALLAGFAAFLGHLFPIWLGFKGGKGVATYLGILLGIAWPAVLAFAVIWLMTAKLTRLSSLAALISAALVPLVLYVMARFNMVDPRSVALFVVLSILIFITHRANIRRLLAGTETRIGSKS